LEEKREELVKIVESFERLEKSKEWQTLKELVFSKSVTAIERQLLHESLATEIDPNKLYRLQGEWSWARQYNDTGRFIETLKKQLADIKSKLE
jgi:hypothetical protein